MTTQNEQEKPKFKRMAFDIPTDLYEQFLACKLRRDCNTDSEGVRSAIKKAIESDRNCQVKNGEVAT